MKNTEEKPRNKSKEIKPKIMNGFLVWGFITFYLFDYYHNVMPTGYFTKKSNGSNPVHLNYSLRYKTECGLHISINPP